MAKTKKVWIPQFFNRDEKALSALARTGILEKDDFTLLGIAKGRLKNYGEKRAELVVTNFNDKTGKKYYTLTDIGKEFVRNRYGIEPYQHKSYNHDSDLRDKYMSLTQDQRNTVQTELEFRNQTKNMIQDWKNSGDAELRTKAYDLEQKWNSGQISSPDFTYEIQPGVVVFYETVTSNYKQSEIEAKVEMANTFGCQIQMNKV